MQAYGLLKAAIHKSGLVDIGGVMKPGVNMMRKTQVINDETIEEKVNSFSLPVGAYVEIGKTIAGELQGLYDPLTKEAKVNIGEKVKF